MEYKVHRLDVSSNNMKEQLEDFLELLNGQVVSIIPNGPTNISVYGCYC